MRLALAVSLMLAVVYGLPDMRVAFGGPYVVQNDARQHVFWMARFQDPTLFPHDPIADYFQAVTPAGYALLYRAAAAAGLDPISFSKLLPLALALVSAGYTFGLTLRVLPVAAAGLISSVLLSQHLWLTDEMASGTPHAFAIPLLVAFLYHLARRSVVPCATVLALQGLIYPQILLVSCGTLVLWLVRLEGGRLEIRRDPRDLALFAAALTAGAASMLPFALESSRFGPTVSAAVARRMPEFFPGGRARFFERDAWDFWVTWHRSGLLAKLFSASGPFIFAAVPMLAGLLLPALLARPGTFPVARRVTPGAGLLLRLGLASVALFAIAHASIFRLHVPSRYSMFSVRVILAVAAGATWVILADAAWRILRRRGAVAAPWRRELFAAGAAVLAALVLAPLFQKPAGDYTVGKETALYRFIARQPTDVVVASLSLAADDLPSFSRRSVLVSRQTAVPYQLGYYLPIRRRATELIGAEYAVDPRELRAFVRAYGVDFLVLDRWSFRPRYLTLDSWVRQYTPLVDELAARMEAGAKPALELLAERCTALATERTIVVDAQCILESSRDEEGGSR